MPHKAVSRPPRASSMPFDIDSYPDQSRCEEAIHATKLGPEARMSAEKTFLRQRFRQGRQFLRTKRIMADAALPDGLGDAQRAFLGLQRANDIDQTAIRPQHGSRGIQQIVLDPNQRLHVSLALQVRNVRMAPDGAGGTAGGIQ